MRGVGEANTVVHVIVLPRVLNTSLQFNKTPPNIVTGATLRIHKRTWLLEYYDSDRTVLVSVPQGPSIDEC